jgi:hypothetical protein
MLAASTDLIPRSREAASRSMAAGESVAPWCETRGVAALLTIRKEIS